jgi:antitoxin HicB
LGTSAQDVHRLTQLRHSTKIDGIESALQALGKRRQISAV